MLFAVVARRYAWVACDRHGRGGGGGGGGVVTYGSPMEMYLSWGLVSPISTAFLFEAIFVEYILRALRPDGRAYKMVLCGC